MSNVEDQVADIRERVASIEAQLVCILNGLNRQRKENGSVVIPVAAVITVLEVAKLVLEKFT